MSQQSTQHLKHRRRCAATLFTAIFLATGIAHAQTRELSSTGELLDGIVAVVNDGVVLKSELQAETDQIVARLQKQGTQLPPPQILMKQVLDRLIIQQLQLQRAEKVGIQVSDETLNQALASIAQRNNVQLAELPALLAREGVDYTTYRRDLRQQISIDQLRQRDVLQRINVSPKEVDAYLARAEGKASLRQEFLLSHILIAVPANATTDQVETAERQVNDLYQRLKAGEDFAKLAVAYSNGQQALEGGSLGWRKGSELPSLFADVAPGLGKGEVAPPVRNASGFHLIKLDDRRGGEAIMENQTHARHILLTTNEVLDDTAAQQQLKAIRARILGGEDFASVAKAVSNDPQSALAGGDLGWTGPGNFVPAFEAQMNKLAPNEISEPFRTQFGWHLLQVLERRVYDATADKQRQEAILAIRNSRLGDEVEIWTRRLRDEAFVEYRL
ncbi:MAG: peptidylprolyl isomerase [Gammaproteobacteria bacterium]